MKKFITYIKNFFFCLKYPFWKTRNVWTGKFMGYSSTFYDWIPDGWRIAFGKQLSKDIKKAGKESRRKAGKYISWRNLIHWEQIKEKYGSLRLYAGATEEIQRVLSKYEHLSIGYCIDCGKPARYCSKGWIEFYCEDCFENAVRTKDPEIKKECRLTFDDIPYGCSYSEGKEEKIDYKDKYGIDFVELWGLNNER